MEELRQIALDLLESYHSAEESAIHEYITHDVRGKLADLERKVSELRDHIVNIT
ncbi:hypothetical protein [Paenibacillus odorifer]|uniref:hypothetical protein n=1 Tax=Paenibacillus TaxID=44249 RepID=UPI0015C30AC0|nr:hypothetical protein [Paenibacillus odorifer]